MYISSKLADERFDPEKPAGGYEWWYFDAISLDNNWSIVIIFYEGNPFSPEYIQHDGNKPSDHPAVSISLYHRGKCEYYSFLEYKSGKFHWDDEETTASIGTNFFKREEAGGLVEYELLMSQSLASGHSIEIKIKFLSEIPSEELLNEQEEGLHKWNLLQPRAKVTGSITVNGRTGKRNIGFSGTGYHDHNVGYEPMKDSFDDWYWGRFHFKDSTLIYYLMNQDGKEQKKGWLISQREGKVIDVLEKSELHSHQKTLLGINSARKIILSGSKTEVNVQQSRLLDNGPFYQRFMSDCIMNTDKGIASATGITEYIKPAKIYEQKYWWMINMRLRYLNKKPHWVQRSKGFYELTW